MIRVFAFGSDRAAAIERFSSVNAGSVPLAHGGGAAHAYAIHFEAGGLIGPHPAGFDQLLLVVQGSGWVAGADGLRHALGTCEGAFIPTGELHTKGSDGGMLAIMLQASEYGLDSAVSARGPS